MFCLRSTLTKLLCLCLMRKYQRQKYLCLLNNLFHEFNIIFYISFYKNILYHKDYIKKLFWSPWFGLVDLPSPWVPRLDHVNVLCSLGFRELLRMGQNVMSHDGFLLHTAIIKKFPEILANVRSKLYP